MVNVQADKGEAKRGISVLSKFYILIAFTTLLGFAASYLFSVGSLLYGTVLLVLFLSFFIIEALFIFIKPYMVAAVVLNSVAFALPFLKLFSKYFLVGFIVLVLFLLHGAYRGRHEMDNMVKIHFTRLVRVISRSIITAIVIFLSIVIILNSNFSISKESTDKTIRFASPIIGRFIEGFNAEVNTGVLLSELAEKELSKSEEFIALPVIARRSVVENQVAELKLKIEESIGTTINLNQSVSDNIYEIVSTKLSALTPKTQIYWSAALIATVWLSVQSVEFIIYIPLAILVFLIYELLLSLKFAAIQMETKSKEVISLK